MLPAVRRGATVRDLAARTGLSIATVSRALNGQANVAEHTRRRVLEAAGRKGRPEGGVVYLRCPYLLTDYFGLIVSSVERVSG